VFELCELRESGELIDSPWSLLGCGEHASKVPPQGKAGENGQPGGCLGKSSLQETVGYAGGKLPAGVANDWVIRRSLVPCFADSRVSIPCSSLAPLAETSSWRPALAALACTVWRLNVQSGLP
jgi:hypothetical protein